MADELNYYSGPDAGSHKRKYDDQTPPSASFRKPTGFSSPNPAPSSYNSVPPPLDSIEMAKQKAQEIAARLTAASYEVEVKRPRADNNGSGGGGFNNDKGFSYPSSDIKTMPNSGPSSIPVSYDSYNGSSKRIEIPQIRVGVIIGKGGETIKYLQQQSGAKIQIQRDMDADTNSLTRPVDLTGTAEQIARAEQLIHDVLAESEAGGSSGGSRRSMVQPGSEQFEMKIPNNKVGLVIGKGGETIKNMQARTGARIQVIPLRLPPGDTSMERALHIDGTSEQIQNARELVDEITSSENRMRNPAMAGGYSQQGYQAQPPSSWGQGAPPMQQSGYGSYPPQYNMSQPPYGGYPSQSSSVGYASGWDQSAIPPNQQNSAASGYDYYNKQHSSQQQQTPGGSAVPADNSGYSYSEPPASSYAEPGQYPQVAYSGYYAPPQSGYGQPSYYDQQQGYGSAPSYGNATTQTQEGHTPSYGGQGDSSYSTSQPSSNTGSYPPRGSSQPNYGMPPTSQTGYGTQPLAQSGYDQSGYHSQPPSSGYGQQESDSKRTQSSSYDATSAQPGYGAPPYGAQASQPGYEAPYNTSYSSGYSQPTQYPTENSANGSTSGTYDAAAAAPASQTAQQGGVAKASPQS